jgi:hypothetical protein
MLQKNSHIITLGHLILLSRQTNTTYFFILQPNQYGKGVPIFYMLCNNDKKQGHEKKAIELALTYVFISFGKVRLSDAIDRNVHCWTIGSEGRIQVVGKA